MLSTLAISIFIALSWCTPTFVFPMRELQLLDAHARVLHTCVAAHRQCCAIPPHVGQARGLGYWDPEFTLVRARSLPAGDRIRLWKWPGAERGFTNACRGKPWQEVRSNSAQLTHYPRTGREQTGFSGVMVLHYEGGPETPPRNEADSDGSRKRDQSIEHRQRPGPNMPRATPDWIVDFLQGFKNAPTFRE